MEHLNLFHRQDAKGAKKISLGVLGALAVSLL
jgi:hypothetical protein